MGPHDGQVDWQAKFERADRHVFDLIRQRHDAAASLAVVEEVLVGRCQHATDDNDDLRSALLELRIVRAHLDPRLEHPLPPMPEEA